MGRIVLWILGIFWALLGGVGLLAPAVFVAPVGIELGTADATAEARAMYGGAQIGIGLFLVYCARAEERVRTGLVGLALLAGCLAAGRGVGILAAGSRSGVMLVALAIEVGMFALAAIALAREGGAGAPVPEAGRG